MSAYTLQKQAYSNILKILPPKNENLQIKIRIFYLQISLSRNKNNNVYPCKPQFYHIKVGFVCVCVSGGGGWMGSTLYRHVFVMNCMRSCAPRITGSPNYRKPSTVSRRFSLKRGWGTTTCTVFQPAHFHRLR